MSHQPRLKTLIQIALCHPQRTILIESFYTI